MVVVLDVMVLVCLRGIGYPYRYFMGLFLDSLWSLKPARAHVKRGKPGMSHVKQLDNWIK